MSTLPIGAISLDGVSRRFRIQHIQNRTLKARIVRGTAVETKDFWALRDIDLKIQPGESIGIVGRNGSGKSTILKLIAGIMGPTAGTVRTAGTIASMLELGAGFHPDFSGRENVFLNAAIFGFSEREVVERFDDIVAFAEVEDFIDAPVRTYSSGMHMRLAFSIASHVRADIMLLDEVFSVGDESFQRKCLSRMFDFRRHGGTIVFVSHDADAVEQLCDRALLVEHGEMIIDGPPRTVFPEYHRLLAAQTSRSGPTPAERASDANSDGSWGTNDVTVTSSALRRLDGDKSDTYLAGDSMVFECAYRVNNDVPDLVIGMSIHTVDGILCHRTTTEHDGLLPPVHDGEVIVRFTIPELPFQSGTYDVSVSVGDTAGNLFHVLEHHLPFSVLPRGNEAGLVSMEGHWSLQPGGQVVSTGDQADVVGP